MAKTVETDPTDSTDLSEFRKFKVHCKQRCQVGTAREKLAAGDREKLDAALGCEQLDIPAGAIRAWLAERGATAGVGYVTSHRARTCSCFND